MHQAEGFKGQMVKSTLKRAEGLQTQAKEIVLVGRRSSAAVAHVTMNRFVHLYVPGIYSDELVLQRVSCMNCSDVVFCLRIS